VSIKLSREEEEKSFQITKELMQRIEESVALLKEVPFPRRPAEDDPIIQHRFEVQESGLVLMWEIPPFKRHNDIKHRYKIGDGAGLDYSFKSLEMLENFVKMLKRSMLARVPE